MQVHSSINASPTPILINRGLVVLSGYGLEVKVEHGQLQLRDGLAGDRREGRFSRATCGIKRFVILGHTGSVTLEALRWLFDIGAAIVQIDADGQVILTTAPLGLDNSQLRRAQAAAYGRDQGLQIVRHLLERKLTGQTETARALGEQDDAIGRLAEYLSSASDAAQMRLIEAKAASLYWSCWSSVPVNFARRDADKVPDHWRTFTSRMSPLTSSPRRAANPANALLNYLYALLEAETRIALITVGLDPSLGFLHADQPARDSLACDVMEAIRPQVDAWLLRFLESHTFASQDFFERANGTVRVTSRITPALAVTSSIWAKAVAPVAEWLAQEVISGGSGARAVSRKITLPTRLTESRRSAGRDGIRTKPKSPVPATPAMPSIGLKPCKECGDLVEGDNEFCSDECYDTYRQAVLQPKFETAGVSRLSKLRANGIDPAHGGDAGTKRGKAISRRASERAAWEAANGDGARERRRFEQEILPRLNNIPIRRIQAATGLSLRYCSLIRQGLEAPHPIHYEALQALVRQLPQGEPRRGE